MHVSPEATCGSLEQRSERNLFARAIKWLSSREQTNTLADLSDEQLRDIGVDPRLTTKSRITEAARISLLDLYWPQHRQSRRRR
jgi:uncharacterized protein YjiS (DUF1127 family)